MMRLPALVFACLSAMALSGSVGQANAASPDVETIRQREQHRVRLLTARDYDALEKMTSPTLTNLRSGQVVFSKLQHRDPAVRFLAPDVAILNSLADVEVSVGGTLQKMVLRLTIVYVRKDGEWLFEAWHSSRLPD
ncbi:MAG: nuclear transport factor 2 family protein [Vicinamibacterales bacterium]|nr:nuclear transport factor 2 family protein [Vicinamibacterales bacterium]